MTDQSTKNEAEGQTSGITVDEQPPPTAAEANLTPAAEGTLLGSAAVGIAESLPEPSVEESPTDESAAEPPAPLAYAAFKLPDGIAADDPGLAEAVNLFKQARLPQDQAQKFIDLALQREATAAQKSVQAFLDLQERWVSEIKADREIGGSRLPTALASAARAIDRLRVAGLREALDLTGAGNHPAVVKAFVTIGRMLAEDRFAAGRPPRTVPRSAAETIYGERPRGSDDTSL